MEDQAAAVGEVGSNAVGVVLAGHSSSINGSASGGTILAQEGDVVGLLDLDTSDLIQAITGVHGTLGVAVLTVQDVGVNLADQGVVLTGGQHSHTTILRSSDFIKTGSSFKEAINQCLGVILLGGTQVDLETTRLAGYGSGSRGGLVQNAEDATIIELSKALADLTGDRATDVILAHHLIQAVHKGTGDQQIVHCDGGLSSRRVASTQDGHTSNVVTSRDTTGVNELGLLATTEGPVHDQILSDGAVTEGFVDFASEQLQEKSGSTASFVSLAKIGRCCRHES